jgi:hypothetical protein
LRSWTTWKNESTNLGTDKNHRVNYSTF